MLANRHTEIRSLLAPLSDLAAKHGAAVVCVTHLNKSANNEAWTLVTGSLAFVPAARAAYFGVKDKDDERRRLFLPVKNNIGSDRDGLAFSIEPVIIENTTGAIDTSRLRWEATSVTLTAAEALGSSFDQDEGFSCVEAKGFLLELPEDGPLSAKRYRQKQKNPGTRGGRSSVPRRSSASLQSRKRTCRAAGSGARPILSLKLSLLS